jgi:serine/threonine protein kinase
MSTDNQSTIQLPPSAYMTYAEIARQGPPQPPMKETYNPVLNDAQRKLRVWTVPHNFPTNPLRLQEMYVARQGKPQRAYRRVRGKAPISLDHHGPGWGYLIVGFVFERIDMENLDESQQIKYQLVIEHLKHLQPTDRPPLLVYQEPNPATAEYVAIKTLGKKVVNDYLAAGGNENPYKEIHRMQQLGDNIHVLACVDALQDEHYLYIISPYCRELTLKDNILWKPNSLSGNTLDDSTGGTPSIPSANNMTSLPVSSGAVIDEETVREWFVQILQDLAYLQHHGICHHDVSPDNFVRYKGRWLLFDLAMSLRVPQSPQQQQHLPPQNHGQQIFSSFDSGHSLSSASPHDPQRRTLITPLGNFGTAAYMAPEVFMNTIPFDGFGIDLWAAGVILYNLLTGHLLYYQPYPTDLFFRYCLQAKGLSNHPTNERTVEILMDYLQIGNKSSTSDDDEDEKRRHRQRHELMSRSAAHLRIPRNAMQLLENMLQLDPSQRWNLAQAMNSAWAKPPPPQSRTGNVDADYRHSLDSLEGGAGMVSRKRNLVVDYGGGL